MSTVYDHGAVGDGVADDTAAFQAAANTGELFAPALRANGQPATYRITATINVPSGRVVIEGTVDATAMPAATQLGQRPVFRANGTIGAAINVPSRISLAQRTLPVTNTAKTGDLLLIANNERPVPGMTRTDRSKGELRRVLSATASSVTLSSATYFSYATPATVTPISPVLVRFEGTGTIKCGGVGSGHSGIFITYGMQPLVQGLTVTGAEDCGIAFDYCWQPRVTEVRVENSTSSTTLGNTGYGVLVGAATTLGIVSNSQFFNCRHGISGGGRHPAIYNTIAWCVADDAKLDAHEPTFEWLFLGNTIIGGTDGLLMRGQHSDAVLNRFWNNAGVALRVKTWDQVTVQSGVRSILNRVRASFYGITADGRATVDDPISRKPGLVLWGDRVEESGRLETAAVTVAHATEASVDVFTQRNTGQAGVEVTDSRLHALNIHATDAPTPLRFTESSITDN